MGEKTNIAWCDYTFNAWWGCRKRSAGCLHCYADTFQHRWGNDTFGFQKNGERKPLKEASESYWKKPLRWNEEARKANEQKRVFCASMSDIMDEHPQAIPLRKRVFEIIRQTPHLTWLLLTKNPEQITQNLPEDWGEGYSNVWLGTTTEDQENLIRRVPILTNVPARRHFLSCEPLLSDLNFSKAENMHLIDWVIVGGESGHGARKMEEAWVDNIQQQCMERQITYFFKQTGEQLAKALGISKKGENPEEWPARWQVQNFPKP